MPSKYTDEIENSSYTWRVFYMSSKSKYSAEQWMSQKWYTCIFFEEKADKWALGWDICWV